MDDGDNKKYFDAHSVTLPSLPRFNLSVTLVRLS